MKTYELRCADAGNRVEALTFEAEDVCDALFILQEQEAPKRAHLLEDGKKVCQLANCRVDGAEILIVGQKV